MGDLQDWRLTNQATYLSGRTLRWQDWRSPREGWDHDHCAFCWATFGAAGLADADLTAGYVSAEGNHWICADCFEDFRVAFGWTVEPAG